MVDPSCPWSIADVGEDFEPNRRFTTHRKKPKPRRWPRSSCTKVGETGARAAAQIARDLDHHLGLWQGDRKPGLVMLMEGADPIVHVSDLPRWWQRGLRMIGLTYGDTHYGRGVAGGSTTFKKGGLTPAGFCTARANGRTGLYLGYLAPGGRGRLAGPGYAISAGVRIARQCACLHSHRPAFERRGHPRRRRAGWGDRPGAV